MTPDERWFEAVKHLKKAQELLEGTLTESIVVDGKKQFRKFTLVFDEQVLEPEPEGG